MSRKFVSQTVASNPKFGTDTLMDARNAMTFADSERESIDTMLRSVYRQRSLTTSFLRTQDGKSFGIQKYRSDDRYQPSRLNPTDPVNIAAYFSKHPGEKLQMFVPDYDKENGKPLQNSGSIRYLSLNKETGLYEISDEEVPNADPNFLKEAQATYSKNYSINSVYGASYSPADDIAEETKRFVADMNRYRHDPEYAKEYEKRIEEKRREEEQRERERQAELEKKEAERKARIESGEESEYDPTMTRKEYEDFVAKRHEEFEKQMAKEREERETKKAAEKKAEEERKARQAELEKKRAEKAKIEEEKRAKEAKLEEEKEKVRRQQEEEKEKTRRQEEEAKEKERLAAEAEQAKKDSAEKADNQQLLQAAPKSFPAGFEYTTNSNDIEDLTAHNYEDRFKMIQVMKQSVYGFGNKKIDGLIMTGDGKSLKTLSLKMVKNSKGLSESALTTEDKIQAYFDKNPLGKLQMYWPEDNSMHYLSFDRKSFTYNISNDPVPAPTNLKERAEYEKEMNFFKDMCKEGSEEFKLNGRKGVRNILSNTKNQERIVSERAAVNEKLDNAMSKNWFDALKNRPEVKKDSKSAEYEFIMSCDDKTEHGRTRIYEYAISEFFRMAKEPINKENGKYIMALNGAAPALLESMKRDNYEPGFASYDEIQNVIRNVKVLEDASKAIVNALSEAKGQVAVEKLCQLAYVDTVRQAKATSSPEELVAALSEKSVKAGVKAMSGTMNKLIKQEGGIEKFKSLLNYMSKETQISTITEKFTNVLNGKNVEKSKTTEKQNIVPRV